MSETPTPYVRGARFTIYRHCPPQPTPRGYHHCKPQDLKEHQQMTFIERCLLHTPLPGSTLGSETSSLVINEEIVVCSDHGAQVLGVNGNLIAKFYDPLFYPTPTFTNDVATNPFRSADHHYSHEAAAYETMSGYLGGTTVPRYHGSYTCELPVVSTSGDTTRSVRLILIERIVGTCMQDLDPSRFQLSQHQRVNVMAKIVDADSFLYACGVIHGDLHPRNILLCGDDLGSTNLRVILIDFGSSILGKHDAVKESHLPISPLLRWDARRGRHRLFERFGWVDWDWQSWLEQRWTDSEVYAPVTENLRKRWLGRFDNPPPVMEL